MFTLIESYGDEPIEIEGRTYHAPCLIEDDQGLRWFLTDTFETIRPRAYTNAVSNGAVALLCPAFDGPGYDAITIERFMEDRTEHDGTYGMPQWINRFDEPPAYMDLVQSDGYDPREWDDTDPPEDPTLVEVQGDFVHLHLHTEYSPMDGRTKVPEAMDRIVALGQTAAADTDHGICSGHPLWAAEAKKRDIKAIFGIEAYFVDDRFRRPVEWWEDEDGHRVSEERLESLTQEQRKKTLVRKTDQKEVQYGYHHIVLLAMNDEGLRNIWAASTESFKAFYQVPRMDWDTLAQHSEGVICLTGCLRGPIAQPLIDDDDESARQNLGRLMEIFGDRLYLEVMPNDLPEQVKVNQGLQRLSREYSLPLVATVDSHYPEEEHYRQHQVWVSAQTKKDVQDETELFAHDLGLYIKGREEVEAGLVKAGVTPTVAAEACDNTVRIAERCSAHIPIKNVRPVFSRKGGEEADIERLLDLCLSNWDLTLGKKDDQAAYEARFEHEMSLLIRKGFCGYFLQVADYVAWAKDNHILVGPGRGSGGGSLVAYLARITGIDPVEANLLFDRFMTEGREALPDFDVDFPASKRGDIQDYITSRYGEDNVVRVGTHTRLKNKGVFNDMFRALSSTLPETYYMDQKAISDIIGAAESGTAGLGLSWDELWASEGELLAPYQEKYPEVFEMAEAMVGILKTYGQHPAGLVVSNESIVDALPLRKSDTAQMITQFSLDDLDMMGYIKFDILTLRTLDTIQECIDAIRDNRGIQIDVNTWRDEYEDPQVWEIFTQGHTLGVFQVETAGGIRMCKRVAPTNMSELSDVLTLVRPGPMRSGLTDLYIARRNGESEVSFPDERLSEVLADTYGAILYQEQVMQTCMILAGYDSNKADEVRKILGKKKVELVLAAGKEFVEGCVTNGMKRDDAETLWAQMAEFAKYSFGKAHAWGYAVLAYWTAWLKVHYPVEFFTAVLSTVKEERIPEFVSEARRMGFSILPPDINESGKYFTSQGLNVRYGLASVKGLGEASVDPILAGQPYASYEDFVERSGADAGKRAILARIGAFDSLVPNRRGLETLLMADKTGASSTCVMKDLSVVNGFAREYWEAQGEKVSLPCTYDWVNEPPNVSERTGKILKQKPPPKKCTRACRHWTAPPPLDIATIEPYTEADIRNIEQEVLGLHLSSTVFDQIEDEYREALVVEAEHALAAAEGVFLLAGTVVKMRTHVDRNSKTMAFVDFATERGDIACTVFASTWEKYQGTLSVGDLRLIEVSKNSRGFLLNYMGTPPTK